MNRKHKIKLFSILGILLLIGSAAGLVLYALKQNINLFYTPTQLTQTTIPKQQILRIGGYVKKNSVHYVTGDTINFIITDYRHEVPVIYHGILPNLFREGQGVVVTGNLDAATLKANEVLAKHDEKYMPWPLAKELRGTHAS